MRGRPKRKWLDNIRNDLSERELSGEGRKTGLNIITRPKRGVAWCVSVKDAEEKKKIQRYTPCYTTYTPNNNI